MYYNQISALTTFILLLKSPAKLFYHTSQHYWLAEPQNKVIVNIRSSPTTSVSQVIILKKKKNRLKFNVSGTDCIKSLG